MAGHIATSPATPETIIDPVAPVARVAPAHAGRTDDGTLIPAGPGEGLRPAGVHDVIVGYGEELVASDPAAGKITPMEQTTVIAGKHRTTTKGDKVTIHGLELFVGFDPAMDDPEDSKIAEYDADRIAEVVARTQAMMGKGQNPKLILGHNGDGDGGVKPAVGDILGVQFQMIDGVPGIVGDVEMNRADFEAYVASNAYPRRSAEIWSDGYMSEVALLGGQTPARHLPDTKYTRDGLTVTRYDRTLPRYVVKRGTSSGGSGPADRGVSDSSRRPRREPMTELERARDDFVHAADADVARLGARFQELHRRHIAGPRKGQTPMYQREDAAENQAVLDALKRSDLVMAAKFARRHGIADAQLDEQVVIGRDDFGRAITSTYGDELEQHQRDAALATEAAAWCTREGITDGTTYAAKYEELRRQRV